ncbi:MAG TPA: hypothetical protein PLW35_02455, partial [Verrucomicrobiota bacterium]|nr:hypothetical protein [Verrucomicrobiota bacterium]
IKTKRQQAAALQALRAYQCPLHPRERVINHRDQRAVPCGGVAGHISQPGVAESPHYGGAGAGAMPVRRLWLRLRRVGKYAG